MDPITARQRNLLILEMARAIAAQIVPRLAPQIPNPAYIVQDISAQAALDVASDQQHLRTQADVEFYKEVLASALHAAIRKRAVLSQSEVNACARHAVARWKSRR